jgi:hypothetical protein
MLHSATGECRAGAGIPSYNSSSEMRRLLSATGVSPFRDRFGRGGGVTLTAPAPAGGEAYCVWQVTSKVACTMCPSEIRRGAAWGAGALGGRC